MTDRPADHSPDAPLTRPQLLTRRAMLLNLAKAMAAGAASTSLLGCDHALLDFTVSELVQPHYLDMDDDELAASIKRIEGALFREYRKRPAVATTKATEGVRYAMALDLSTCLGCGRCRDGCVEENNQSRNPPLRWITMRRSHQQEIWRLHETEEYEQPPLEEDDGYYYLPVGCQQCEKPICVRACPAKATWKEPDGITVVDYNWCIGCRYCVAACPYGARRFGWSRTDLPSGEFNPKMHYLGNRPRPIGVVEKCTFCVQRVRAGHNTACVDVCPVGARKFGDINDPTSEVHYISKEVKKIILRQSLGTEPRFFYYFSAAMT